MCCLWRCAGAFAKFMKDNQQPPGGLMQRSRCCLSGFFAARGSLGNLSKEPLWSVLWVFFFFLKQREEERKSPHGVLGHELSRIYCSDLHCHPGSDTCDIFLYPFVNPLRMREKLAMTLCPYFLHRPGYPQRIYRLWDLQHIEVNNSKWKDPHWVFCRCRTLYPSSAYAAFPLLLTVTNGWQEISPSVPLGERNLEKLLCPSSVQR